MASTGTTAAVQIPPTAPAEPPRARNNRPRGGARGGRGGSQEAGPAMAFANGQRGRRGGPAGARGQRGAFVPNAHTRQSLDSAIIPNRLKPPPPGLGGGGSFDGRLTEDARKKEGEGDAKGGEGGAEDVEAEVCFICASPVDHNSVAPCNHRTCHICALRLRALYKTKACAHCRVRIHPEFFDIQVLMFSVDGGEVCNLYG